MGVEDVDEVDIIAMDMAVAVVVVLDVRADIPATTIEVQIALIRVVQEAMVVTEAAMVTIVVQAGETMDGKSLLGVACCIFLSADIMLSIFLDCMMYIFDSLLSELNNAIVL